MWAPLPLSTMDMYMYVEGEAFVVYWYIRSCGLAAP